MLESKFIWEGPDRSYEAKQKEYHPKVEELLVGRKIADPAKLEEFIHGLKEGHDPFLMTDMKKAVDRIQLAVDRSEPILIYGDYDADGVTSIAIMVRCLRELGAVVDFYIPNRFYEGYGPNEDAFLEAVEKGFKLVVTVDNGIAGIEEAKVLAEHGVDLIITDHHHAKEELPDAFAILHPELEKNYPWSHLSGAGVALKLSQALLDGEAPDMYYTLAMLGTVGDVVPLLDENRYLVKRGLQELRRTEMPGLVALMKQAGTDKGAADETTVGFEICPRLNAPGRMDDAGIAANLLITDDEQEARQLAAQIEGFNDERKEVGKLVEAEALEMAKKKPASQSVLILFKEDWHEGILGIVAGKLSKQLGKAVFLLTMDEYGQAKGSGRAVEGFQLFEMLHKAEDLIEKFGGHALAAGLTVDPANISALEKHLNEQMRGIKVQPKLKVDLEISLSDAGFELINQFSALAPFGEGNRRPLIKVADVLVKNVKAIGNKLQHLKFTLTHGGLELEAIAFNLGGLAIYLTADTLFDVVGELTINEYNGRRAVQFVVADLKSDAFQVLDLRNPRLFEDHRSKFLGAPKLSASDIEEDRVPLTELVLDELPPSIEGLKGLIERTNTKSIVLFPYPSVTFPSREKFVEFFKTLKKHPEFALTDEIYSYFERMDLSKSEVNFILKVFFENEIVIIRNKVVSLRQGAGKKPLTDSMTYRLQAEKFKVYETFELSTMAGLKELLQTETIGGCS